MSSLELPESRRKIESSLRAGEGYDRFEEAVADDPRAFDEWHRFIKARIGPRIKNWLEDVAVEPL